MKIHQNIFLVVLVFYLVILMGCSNSTSTSNMPEVGIPLEEMNRYIEIIAPSAWNSFRTNHVVGLVVRVTGKESIAFTFDYGTRLFILQNDDWVEVRNITTYPEGHMIIPPWENNPRNEGGVDMRPDLPNPDKPVLLRIVLIGNIYRDNQVTDEKVGGYIDVNLKP